MTKPAKYCCFRYGVSSEAVAVQKYETTLRTIRHNIQTFHCGLVVDPGCPWLGASPDRVVWDPEEQEPHGIVEIKCPYSMKDLKEPCIQGSCLIKDNNCTYRLNRTHLLLSGDWADGNCRGDLGRLCCVCSTISGCRKNSIQWIWVEEMQNEVGQLLFLDTSAVLGKKVMHCIGRQNFLTHSDALMLWKLTRTRIHRNFPLPDSLILTARSESEWVDSWVSLLTYDAVHRMIFELLMCQ